ncbi:MAG TPA: PD-(D/E)XK nuclease family protein [Candidatus Rubrimentiphilum sp.]|nr:PD-(D/E)XK nuclease family protein [Candidatus Rubrimentiphilum sp.]
MQSAEQRAFLAAALAWSVDPAEKHAARMLRSPFSGVPYDLAAAYVALASREQRLLAMLAQPQLGALENGRDALIAFNASLRALCETPNATPDSILRICERFALDHVTDLPAEPHDGTFDLRERATPEPAEPPALAHPRFSASQLNAYVECERKWFYRYLCAAVEDKGSAASFYGTAFHSALEHFHSEFPRPGDAEPARLKLKLEGLLNAAFERHRNDFGTPIELELQRRRAQRTGRKYIEWLLAEAKRAPFTVIGCELPVEMQIEGYDFIGYIDRLDKDDKTGAVAVIDYKTGTIATSAAEYREQVRQFHDFQLPFYYWARTAEGDRVWKLALLPLKDALLDVQPVVLEVVPVPSELGRSQSSSGVIPLAELERARTRMVEICAQISALKTTAFPVTADPQACTYCVYALACTHRPYPPDLRFGR